MISASLNRCKGMEDQAVDFLKQLAAKLELVLLKHRNPKEMKRKKTIN